MIGTSAMKGFINQCYSEVYSEPSLTTKIERFVKIIRGFKPLTIFAKSSILGV